MPGSVKLAAAQPSRRGRSIGTNLSIHIPVQVQTGPGVFQCYFINLLPVAVEDVDQSCSRTQSTQQSQQQSGQPSQHQMQARCKATSETHTNTHVRTRAHPHTVGTSGCQEVTIRLPRKQHATTSVEAVADGEKLLHGARCTSVSPHLERQRHTVTNTQRGGVVAPHTQGRMTNNTRRQHVQANAARACDSRNRQQPLWLYLPLRSSEAENSAFEPHIQCMYSSYKPA